MVFVKFVVETVPMSTWTRVYYNNTMPLGPQPEGGIRLLYGTTHNPQQPTTLIWKCAHSTQPHMDTGMAQDERAGVWRG